jgi:hypothetical protein
MWGRDFYNNENHFHYYYNNHDKETLLAVFLLNFFGSFSSKILMLSQSFSLAVIAGVISEIFVKTLYKSIIENEYHMLINLVGVTTPALVFILSLYYSYNKREWRTDNGVQSRRL